MVGGSVYIENVHDVQPLPSTPQHLPREGPFTRGSERKLKRRPTFRMAETKTSF